MERYYDAVSNGEIALHNIERAIELSASLGDGEGMPKDAKTLRCHVLGDLAYYCADSFRRGHLQSDADKAIKYAHLLVSSWNAFGDVPPMNLVDNYLFVLATVERLTGQDKSTGKALWQEYRSPLEAHLRSESPELANQHFRLFAEFYGNGAHAQEND